MGVMVVAALLALSASPAQAKFDQCIEAGGTWVAQSTTYGDCYAEGVEIPEPSPLQPLMLPLSLLAGAAVLYATLR